MQEAEVAELIMERLAPADLVVVVKDRK